MHLFEQIIRQNWRCSTKWLFSKIATLLKKRLWYRCFLVNSVKFLRTPFCIEHLWWLLLDLELVIIAFLRDLIMKWWLWWTPFFIKHLRRLLLYTKTCLLELEKLRELLHIFTQKNKTISEYFPNLNINDLNDNKKFWK